MKYENMSFMNLQTLREWTKLGKINFSPSYQRNSGVWSEEKQILLMDSIFRGYIIPPIYFLRVAGGVLEVLDGLQRLQTILGYCGVSTEDVVPKLDFSRYDIKDMGKINGKTCTELLEFQGLDYVGYDQETDFIEHLQRFTIPYIVIFDTNERELKDLFCRLNNGEQLTNGEWLNGLLPTLPLWDVTKRFARDIVNDGGISPIIYTRQRENNKPYSEFDDERKMDVWFWANISLTLYKRVKENKTTLYVNGKSGAICDEYEFLQEQYDVQTEEEKDSEKLLAKQIYEDMTESLPYFIDICRLIPDEMKHAKALHTIFLYAVYLKGKRASRASLQNTNSVPAQKIRVFFNDRSFAGEQSYYQEISEYVEKYKACGSRNDSSSRQKRFNALKKAINL